jgi:hypothetical protein
MNERANERTTKKHWHVATQREVNTVAVHVIEQHQRAEGLRLRDCS